MACATDATISIDASGSDASIFEPAFSNIPAVLLIKDVNIQEAWLKAYRKELKPIIDSGTFQWETLLDREQCTPIMDSNIVKS
jgi:hypothetical protein